MALTPTSLHFKPPASKVKWSLPLKAMRELKKEASGVLSSGKIHFEVVAGSSTAGTKITDKVTWECQVCEEINETAVTVSNAKCTLCGSLQRGELSVVRFDVKPEPASPWKCEVCDEQNDGSSTKCPSCGFSKSQSSQVDTLSSWTCPACTFVNTFSKSTTLEACQVCDTPTVDDTSRFRVAPPRYKVSFRSGGSTIFYNKLVVAWQESRDTPAPASVVGISGLLRRQEEKNLQTEASLSSAFSDLDALMRSAGEMVQLAGRISDKLQNDTLSAPERTAFANLIDSLGIQHEGVNDDSGNEFYRSIAVNVSGLVQAMIDKTGTRVFSLADIYCIYNRTRITGSLIAPADLLKAARQLHSLSLPIRLHKFTQNGLLCLIPAQDVNPAHLLCLLSELVQWKGFVTAVDLAEKMKVSVLLAGQQLAMAEAAGNIIRDAKRKDLPAFYPNLILSS